MQLSVRQHTVSTLVQQMKLPANYFRKGFRWFRLIRAAALSLLPRPAFWVLFVFTVDIFESTQTVYRRWHYLCSHVFLYTSQNSTWDFLGFVIYYIFTSNRTNKLCEIPVQFFWCYMFFVSRKLFQHAISRSAWLFPLCSCSPYFGRNFQRRIVGWQNAFHSCL